MCTRVFFFAGVLACALLCFRVCAGIFVFVCVCVFVFLFLCVCVCVAVCVR